MRFPHHARYAALAVSAALVSVLLAVGCPKREEAAPVSPVSTARSAADEQAMEEIPPIIDTTVVEVNKDNLADFRTPSQGAKETMPEEYRDLIGKAKSGGPPRPDERYVFIGISTGAEYWRSAQAGLQDAALALGVKADFMGPTEQDPKKQADIMDQEIAKKPAGILIAPGRPDTLTPFINKAMDEGIPVICLDTDARDSKRIAYFGTDNYNAGRAGAKILARLIGGSGKVAISSRPGQWNLDERVRGYKEYFAENHPGIQVVAVTDDKTIPQEGEKAASAVLTSTPDLAGFAGVNATSGLGIAAALRAQGKAGSVKVVAMDGDKGILDLIEAGVIHASIAQRQYWMSYIGLAYLYGLNHGVFRAPSEESKRAALEADRARREQADEEADRSAAPSESDLAARPSGESKPPGSKDEPQPKAGAVVDRKEGGDPKTGG